MFEDLDTEQQTVIARQTDITKRIRINGQEAILHVELQLRDSTQKPMWARNAHYQGYLVGKYEMPVYSNVIYFHPNAGRNDPGGYTYTWNDYAHTNRYKVIRLIEIEGQAILEMQAPGLLPFTPLMKPPTGMSPDQWIQECVSSTLAAPVDQSIQSDLLHGISLFGGIIYNTELLNRLIPEALMQESKMHHFYKQRIIRENTIKHILMLLEQQFHPDAVRALTPAIEKIEDLQRLEQIFRAAAKPQNLETFAQMVHE